MSRNVLIILRVRNIDTWWLLFKVWRALFLPNFVSRCFLSNLSQNAKRASARKDTGLDQSLFSVQLFRLRINIIKVCKGANKGHLGGLDKVFKIRDHHHRIHLQILRPNEGLILILAQS